MVIYIILFMTILVNKKSKNTMYLTKLIWGCEYDYSEENYLKQFMRH